MRPRPFPKRTRAPRAPRALANDTEGTRAPGDRDAARSKAFANGLQGANAWKTAKNRQKHSKTHTFKGRAAPGGRLFLDALHQCLTTPARCYRPDWQWHETLGGTDLLPGGADYQGGSLHSGGDLSLEAQLASH